MGIVSRRVVFLNVGNTFQEDKVVYNLCVIEARHDLQ